MDVYKISTSRNVLAGNSLVAYVPESNVSLLLLFNEREWDRDENYEKLFRILSLWEFLRTWFF